jgi:hypothetical protein
MRQLRNKVVAGAAASALAIGALAAPAAFANNPPPPSQCNAGNGNGSDAISTVVGAHCFMGDPGNSFANNKGGDEIPTSGGISNPGGNNTPG